jgi:hypothetical protein
VIAEVFDLLSIRGTRQRAGGVAEQFHGDGADGDVDIVTVNCELVNAIKPAIDKPTHQEGFLSTDRAFRALDANSPLPEPRFGLAESAKYIMCALRDRLSAFWGKLAHSKVHGFASVASGDSSKLEPSDDSSARDAEHRGNGLDGFPGLIWNDYVVNCDIGSFSGHVYNLQTYNGMYVAGNSVPQNGNNGNGIVVHNCRCSFIVRVAGFKSDFRRIRGEGIVPYKTYNEWADAR